MLNEMFIIPYSEKKISPYSRDNPPFTKYYWPTMRSWDGLKVHGGLMSFNKCSLQDMY